MLQVLGKAVYSSFRWQKLLQKWQQVVPSLQSFQANYLYVIDVSGELSVTKQDVLSALLSHGPNYEQTPVEGAEFFVTPRLGTVSPWSSKATDIVQGCELSQVVRVERVICYRVALADAGASLQALQQVMHDPLTESVITHQQDLAKLFHHHSRQPLQTISVSSQGKQALLQANENLGLALSIDEIDYLLQSYQQLQRDPTDVELMMFAQANSEHCRHKLFNGQWTIDGQIMNESLFSMIRYTHQRAPEKTLTAYADNAAVIEGFATERWYPQANLYQNHPSQIDILMKVETHNHPTAISPYPGAATGSGGEIRDEGATGCGAKPKAGLTGFTVSNLKIPGFTHEWEGDYGKPARISSPLQIMLEGPIGGASFNNEFGRPNLCGYFRSFELGVKTSLGEQQLGYHKPIMLAGGLGNIDRRHVGKNKITPGALLIVLGGPGMEIGLGGGAASSMTSGVSDAELDFASVQRDNPEIQRRCQEVIDSLWGLGDENPILSIHDVGAGGLSNALPELVNDSDLGGQIELREILNAEPGMSPLAIWCNESQERYVLAIAPEKLSLLRSIAERERCPFAVVGTATSEQQLQVTDRELENKPIDLPLSVLLGKPPKVVVADATITVKEKEFTTVGIDFEEALQRVLSMPTVASKQFLITIGDRSVGGLVARDQFVGPWQVPVADVAVTSTSFSTCTGEAMAMGERTPVAVLDAPASGRMAVAEALTNLLAADVQTLGDIKLSANWMAAAKEPGQGVALYRTVQAVAKELCPALGISIPVGKDSLSMASQWQEGEEKKRVTSPLSLIISAFAPVLDVNKTLTPQLQRDPETVLLLIDLGNGKCRLGGSILAQVYSQLGKTPADLESPELIKAFFTGITTLKRENLILAYHDRSDGGVITTLLEMAFAGRCGLDLEVSELGEDPLAALFTEELGAVLQVRIADLEDRKSVV